MRQALLLSMSMQPGSPCPSPSLTSPTRAGGFLQGGAAGNLQVTMPLAFTISLLSWGTLEFPKGYAKAGTQQQTLDNIKWGADWLVKAVGASTNGSSNSSGIVYQTGNLTTDQTVRLPSAGLWQGSPCSPLSSSLRARH